MLFMVAMKMILRNEKNHLKNNDNLKHEGNLQNEDDLKHETDLTN